MAVPKIRFQGFTEDWEQRKLGDIVERITRKNTNNESDLPLTISAQYGLIDQNEFFDKRIASKDVSGYYLVKNGEFAYNKSTSNDAPWGAVKRLDRYKNGVVSTLYIVFSIRDSNTTDSDFLATYYDTDRWHSGIQAVAAEGARNHGLLNISASDFFNTTLKMPADIEEQRKIGAFFKEIDNTITLHQRKLESMKLLKKSLLQKMFPKSGETVPEVRFPGFTDAWEQRKFEDIAKRRSDSTISSRSLPCVEYEDVISEQGTLNKDISQKENAKTGIVFESGDVLFGKLRPYLKNWLLPDFNGVAVGDWWILKPVSIDGNFLYRLIQTNEFMSVANVSSGSKMPRSDWALVSKTYFSVPPDISEQRKIGTFFRDIDHTITLHQRKVEALQKLKKSLLQQMFV